jgi:hypothetical protein
LERQIHDYLPFDVCAMALHEFFRGHEMKASESRQSEPVKTNQRPNFKPRGRRGSMKPQR